MQTYLNKRKTPDRAAPPVQEAAPSRSEMLHLSGAGAPQPMSPQLREKFEPGFGADFSNIRISRGHIPEELGVEAVAQGTDILLDERAGMDVLGHELAHVVQQAQGRVEGGFPVVENAALEHEADVMGARVSSGLTAEAGPQNGFGGETMSIAPMSSASAPAQCKSGKSKEEKKMDKMQISNPTVLQPGQRGYQNGMLDSKALDQSRAVAATTHSVALSQMLSSMHDPAYMQQVMAHTGSTSEDIRTDMGKLVGADYARGAASLDTNGQMSVRDQDMFRTSHMYNQNFARFVQGEMKQSSSQAIAAAKGSQISHRVENGKNIAELPSDVVDQQFQAMADEATSSAPVMAAIDGFFSGMRSRNTTMSDEHLEGIMSNDVFLRGGNPQLIEAAVASKGQDAEGAEKISALSMALQKKLQGNRVNLFPGRMAQAAPVPAPAPQAAAAQEEALPEGVELSDPVYEEIEEAAAQEEALPEGVELSDPVYEEIEEAAAQEEALPEGVELSDPVYEEVEEAPAAQKKQLSPLEEMMGLVARSERNRVIPRESFDEMTDEKGNLLDAATIAANANAAFPAGRDEMISMFDPKTIPRREARAATQAAEEETFSGSMRSLFDDVSAELLEAGMPHAPGVWDEEAVSGFGQCDDLEPSAALPPMPSIEFAQIHPALQEQMNLSDAAENRIMEDVTVLDPAAQMRPAPAPAQKKTHWWLLWT